MTKSNQITRRHTTSSTGHVTTAVIFGLNCPSISPLNVPVLNCFLSLLWGHTHTHTHARIHARTHERTHTHTHTHTLP